jgi:hypothetical protein
MTKRRALEVRGEQAPVVRPTVAVVYLGGDVFL